jgi:signal transduction histidine kinase
MGEFLRRLFDSDFMPHGHCYYWQADIVWLHLVSDVVITLAYYSIPVSLGYFVARKRDVPFPGLFVMFGLFILGCGTTHAMEVWTLWHGTYRLAGVVKALTAALSIGTALVLVRVTPAALSLRGPAEWEEANQALLASAAEVTRVNAELQAFSYSVSHDLRAPLRAMQGFSQALLEDYGDRLDDRARSYAERIAGAAAHMDQLIQDILAYSRLTTKEIQLQAVDLRSVVERVSGQMAGEIRAREAEVTVASSLPSVASQDVILTQVLENLLSNALKFVTPGVRPRIRVWAEEREGKTRLWIEDNGIGIAPEHQDRIFQVFERLHGRESYPGTGIGLAIVRRGMERLRGAAGVESEPGKGSRFWIELPGSEHA